MTRSRLVEWILVTGFSSMLVVGCASSPSGEGEQMTQQDDTCVESAQTIADAEAAVNEAASVNGQVSDARSTLEDAESAQAAGDCSEAQALAQKALQQAQLSKQQALEESDRMADEEEASMGSESSASMESMGSSADSYTVERGDNLWNISGKQEVYADPFQWPLIYKANSDQIEDADLIYPGQQFDIDRSASGAAVDAAIEHAKTRGAWSLGRTEASDEAYLAR